MIVNCRPSQSPPKYIVRWYTRVRVGGINFDKLNTRIKNTYADAEGLVRGLQKRDVVVLPLERV